MISERIPAVSIVIPTYNHARFLHEALLSVRAQTIADWEAIVVNNFSVDDTIEVIAAFNDARIRLVNFRNEGIIAASRNHGVKLARADLIAFLDSDDSWHPRKLEFCLVRLGERLDLVCHGETWIGGSIEPRQVVYGPDKRAIYESLLFDGNCLSTSAVVVRKRSLESVGSFSEDPAIVTAEDYDLWLRLSASGCRIGFINDILGEYRIHEGGQSQAALRNMNAILTVIEKHYAGMNSPGILRRIRWNRCKGLVYYGAARALQKNGEFPTSLQYFRKAFGTFPFIARVPAAAMLTLVDWAAASFRKAAN